MDLATECITNEFTDGYNPSAFHRSLVERHTHRRSSRRITSVGLSSITKKYLLYIYATITDGINPSVMFQQEVFF